MIKPPIKDLKQWRLKHRLSQRRLANLARINVITLRKIETWKSKPLKETLKKLQDVVKAIEAEPVLKAKPAKAKKRKATVEAKPVAKPPAPMIDLKSFRKRHGLSQAKLAKLAKVSLNTILNTEAGKHKPMKGTLLKIEQAIKAVESKPVPKAKPATKVSATEVVPIKLSNLDLELIGRILGMSGRQKVELLKKMM